MGYLLDDQRLVQIERHAGRQLARPCSRMQDIGGTQKTIEAGVRAGRRDAAAAPTTCAASRFRPARLILGTNCGGSDGNSGITANPALGRGQRHARGRRRHAAILAETTEIYGAEQLLTRRAVTPAVAEKLIERIQWWEWYTGMFGVRARQQSIARQQGGRPDDDLRKVARRGGQGRLAPRSNEVYQYAEQVTAKGFVVMDTPGFDPVSVTGIVAGGAT